MPENVGDLGKLIVAKGFKTCPKFNKLPNLVTLATITKGILKIARASDETISDETGSDCS